MGTQPARDSRCRLCSPEAAVPAQQANRPVPRAGRGVQVHGRHEPSDQVCRQQVNRSTGQWDCQAYLESFPSLLSSPSPTGADFLTRLHPERAKNRALHQLEAMG